MAVFARLGVGRVLLGFFGGIAALLFVLISLFVVVGLITVGQGSVVLLVSVAVLLTQVGVVASLRRRLNGIERDATSRHHYVGRAVSELTVRVKDLSKKIAAFQIRSATGDPGPVPMASAEIVELEEHGRSIRFDLTPDHHIHRRIRAERRLYEHELLDFLASNFRRGMAIADVGANVGNHAVFFGVVMEAQPLICFEASPVAASHLRRNLELNALDALIVEEALGDTVGTGSLWIRADQAFNPGAARLEMGDGDIPVTTLDASVERLDVRSLDLVKIDVEGMELDVLRGAKRLLEQSRPDLLLEFQTEAQLSAGREFLDAYGYQQGQVFNYTPTYHFFVAEVSKTRRT